MDNSTIYPPTAFYFTVRFCGQSGISETSFKEVSGIKQTMNTKKVKELNGYEYSVPTGITYSNLVLKRGIAPVDSPLIKWCKSVFEGMFQNPICCMPLTVFLMDEQGSPLRGWTFSNAFPKVWEVGNFDSLKNEVAIETIELEYQFLERIL
ncbi:MAG: phage tail protein [Bacteroidales bacterium]|nr:phage tail protein [Bacteroidales bacterium]